MNGIATNSNPLMTKHLVEDLRAFRSAPVTILDVGARGGINEEWLVFGQDLRVICFEPDEEECKRLQAQSMLANESGPRLQYVPTALGGTTGGATLYEARLPASTSLYRTRMSYFDRFVNGDNGVVVGERQVQVQTLDEACRRHDIGAVDFMKLDVEGAELDVLNGGAAFLRTACVLGVLSEIRFHRAINGSPPFASLDAFMESKGFSLFNLHVNRHSRRALPYPQRGDYRLPSGERVMAFTTHGQMQDGDALYFRDLLLPAEERAVPASTAAILKLCALMEIYSLSDCAAELIVANADRLSEVAEPRKLLNLLTAGIAGSQVEYESYLDSYFRDKPEQAAPRRSLTSLWGRLLGRKSRVGS
jgi:FkbM family methyltransferase